MNNSHTARKKTRRSKLPELIRNPELVFGLVGPIGVDLEPIVDSLIGVLMEVKYSTEIIHLTKYMNISSIKKQIDESSYYTKYKTLIEYANEFRNAAGSSAAMAGLAVIKIRELRKIRTSDPNAPALGVAYIIRQFKRPEEIALMRRIYGRKFIQVSIYGSPFNRRKVIMDKIASYDASPKKDADREYQAIELIDTDANQADEINGQRLSDVFHLGDVFVDGIDKENADKTIRRFIRAFFGDNISSPTIDEFGLYTAASAALRSVDLSRQVGAAIFTARGDLIAVGCNEVPRAGGGNYWPEQSGRLFRDIERGVDANHARKAEILFDLVDRLGKAKLLNVKLSRISNTQTRVNEIMSSSMIRDAQIMDIIEFGRMIHAEMSAITDSARLGRPVLGATLFCTTFPCHLCAKHIVSAGIKRVVFLEPYPKSAALHLHDDSITLERDGTDKVSFEPFIGISPRRYRDIFEKRKRKGSDGKAIEWYEESPVPMIEDKSSVYIENEEPEIFFALPKFSSRLRKSRKS